MRISEKMLYEAVERMGPEYRLDAAYGGWKVMRKQENDGYEDIFRVGYVSKPLLNDLINAYNKGYSDALLQR